ncbi:MAG: hypothetical protein A2745_03470 [Candidatus Harrisonbacteria bacterium RIFCSPHIGHO2_01_FULL_44_13]|uniref:Response regulatory domain-containing protein n=1 Tax=Candidatus Harrisonbacteria bacterium RIFCSPLOWO2_01_FULL_44_18 TaxID=1798407 RepID=A0A1G1ZNH8_9BACT|nr:MAG: hypothetical protein A2745_03470 [Candidatus Harrisonbacteria bacterium RIFCSPHIGHO2_01_FULL_44_13]OGY65979.1 MAG: hypothetical protein A3A16_01160 [Candidatus Harrisonbacteria bacterium RIFCSPLOWO2_01_FULL_44_18]
MKIVIVEDEEILLKVLKEKFEKANFDVWSAINGDEAFAVIKKTLPDMVVLDLILPGKSGFEVLQELKLDAETKLIPVIVLSNLGQDEDIKKALQMGAEDYIVKTQHPINEVIEKVKARILSKSR